MAHVVKIKTKKSDSSTPGEHTLDVPLDKSPMCVIKEFNERMYPTEHVTHYLNEEWEWKALPTPKTIVIE